MVTPGSCSCPNGQIPSWHKRKRRETDGVCREEELREEHNRYVKEYVERTTKNNSVLTNTESNCSCLAQSFLDYKELRFDFYLHCSVTELIDNLLTKIYGEETPPVDEGEAVTEVFP